VLEVSKDKVYQWVVIVPEYLFNIFFFGIVGFQENVDYWNKKNRLNGERVQKKRALKRQFHT
jgi:hypothetical protein